MERQDICETCFILIKAMTLKDKDSRTLFHASLKKDRDEIALKTFVITPL